MEEQRRLSGSLRGETCKRPAVAKGVFGSDSKWWLLRGFSTGTEGDPYLDRLRIIQTPLFAVYLHRIHRADAEPCGHDHPWAFAGIILDGQYTEEIWPDKFNGAESYERARGRFSVGRIRKREAHRIITTDGTLWSLVVTGPRRQKWGFYPDGQFVPWREYLGFR